MKKVSENIIASLICLLFCFASNAQTNKNPDLNDSTKYVLIKQDFMYQKHYNRIAKPDELPRKYKYVKNINTVYIYCNRYQSAAKYNVIGEFNQ